MCVSGATTEPMANQPQQQVEQQQQLATGVSVPLPFLVHD